MGCYEEYRESGVGWLSELPSHWELRRISALYDARNEKVSDQDYPPLSVTMQGIVPQLETAAKTQDGDNRKLVRTGDFVINSRSDRRGACGISEYDGSVTLISNVLAPKDRSTMSTRYYSYLFRSEGFADEFYRQGTGIVDDLWSTNWTRMKNILVARPPLAEQERIADYLDAKTTEIDALVADCEREVELLQEYRKAVITEAVTKGLDPDAPMKDSGIEWIGEIPDEWKCCRVKQVAYISSGATPNRDNYSYWNGTIPWVKTGELQNALISESEECITETALDETSVQLYPAGTILMAMYGQGKTRGMTGMLAMASTTNQACAAIQVYTSDESMFIWKELIAGYDAIRDVALGSGQPNLNAELVSNFHIPLPNSVEEQRRIVAVLDAKTAEIGSLIENKQAMADKLREYRRSLISEAVTGKFKVPGI